MKRIRMLTSLFAVALGLALALAPKASAYHDNGVAACSGCHTMHNSEQGILNVYDNSSTALLKGETSSDMCLNCHGTSGLNEGVMSAAANLTSPDEGGVGHGGGDFVFLLEDNLNDGDQGAANPIPGEWAGHNVIAPSKGLSQDSTLSTSPGGSYSSGQLGCTSCHHPHGGPQFRFLHYGANPKGSPSGFATVAMVVAEEVDVSLASEANNRHTAYKSNMTDFCTACHGAFHSESSGRLVHPTRTVGNDIASNYNTYFGTGQPDVGASPYLAAIPVEINDPNNTTTFTGDITGTAKVMCLSCHRSHASSSPKAGRWDFNVTFLAEDGAESGSYPIPNPYAATAGAAQKSLCNKCHKQDAGE